MVFLKLFLMFVLTAVGNSLYSPARNSDPRLKLSGYSDKELHGCYHHSIDLKLCFDLGSDVTKLSSTNGSILVYLVRGLRDGLSLFQILDDQFVHGPGFPSYLVALSADAPASTEELLVDIPRQYAYNETFLEGNQQHVRKKLKELREAPEMLLLELLSAALGRQKHQIKSLLRFHATIRVLLYSMDIQLPPEFRAPDLPRSGRKKRCTDLQSNPNANKCLGMCGPGCSCWSWVCGDCCLHIGCQQHDTCCRVGGWISARCLLPFFYGITCSRYGGYPGCLQ